MIPLPLPAGQRKLSDIQLMKQAMASGKFTHIDEQPLLAGLQGRPAITPPTPEILRPPIAQGSPTELPEQLQNRPLLQPPVVQRPEDAIETIPETPFIDKGYVTKETEPIKKALETPQKDGFISKIAQQAITSKGDVITKQQAENLPAKKSEKEAIDLDSMFKGRKSIPKEEFAQTVTEQMPEVRVIEMREPLRQADMDEGNDLVVQAAAARGRGDEAEAERLIAESDRIGKMNEAGKVKFQSHIKEPVENYRELYITAPEQPLDGTPSLSKGETDELNMLRQKLHKEHNMPEAEKRRFSELMDRESRFKRAIIKQEKATFTTPGGHQTGDPEADTNRIGHIFMGDVTSDKGKGLQLLEEQNDWERSLREDTARAKEQGRDLLEATHPLAERGGRELNLKKFLQKAVEGKGYDYITSVTGQQVADRYDLSKDVEDIEYWKDGDTFHLRVNYKDPSIPLKEETYSKEELTSGNVVDKGVGEKIINGEGVDSEVVDFDADENIKAKTLKNLDLKIGGEWHKKRYDRDNWKTLEKLTGAKSVEIEGDASKQEIRRHGEEHITRLWIHRAWRSGKISKEERDALIDRTPEDKVKQRAIILTPEVREKIKKGLPMFSKALAKRRVA